MAKKILTDKEKIDEFLKWMKSEKQSAESKSCGSGSSWNWAFTEAMSKVYKKSHSIFIEPKIKIKP